MLTAWIRACHPGPTAMVTIVVTALGAKLGWTGWALVGLGLAVLLGQLSVGWSNDAVDATADAAAARADKPTVSDGLQQRTLLRAALGVAAAACVLSWIVAGPVGGTCHVVGIAMGWLYNLRLSRTGWAWITYAIAFGLLPSFVTVGLVGTWPAMWLTAAFAVIGVSAHLANSLRDLDADAAIGVDGPAARLGRGRTRVLAWVLLGVGAIIIAAAVAPTNQLAAAVGLVSVAVLLIASTRLGDSRAFATILAAGGVLAAVVIIGA